MTNTEQNIINLYETLISDGYFRDDNGEINLSVEQFGTNLRNAKIAKAFYANLLDDGYFRDGEEILLSEEDFLKRVGAVKEKREFYPLSSNQMGIYFCRRICTGQYLPRFYPCYVYSAYDVQV